MSFVDVDLGVKHSRLFEVNRESPYASIALAPCRCRRFAFDPLLDKGEEVLR